MHEIMDRRVHPASGLVLYRVARHREWIERNQRRIKVHIAAVGQLAIGMTEAQISIGLALELIVVAPEFSSRFVGSIDYNGIGRGRSVEQIEHCFRQQAGKNQAPAQQEQLSRAFAQRSGFRDPRPTEHLAQPGHGFAEALGTIAAVVGIIGLEMRLDRQEAVEAACNSPRQKLGYPTIAPARRHDSPRCSFLVFDVEVIGVLIEQRPGFRQRVDATMDEIGRIEGRAQMRAVDACEQIGAALGHVAVNPALVFVQ